jgi:uncharacterized protein with FMN-binding domain
VYPTPNNNKRQKMIASFIVILAVVIVTIGVSASGRNQKPASTTASTSQPVATDSSNDATSTSSGTSTTPSNFKDGTFSASTNYETPGGLESMSVSLTIQNGTVTESTLQNKSNNHDSQQYQEEFASTYKSSVVGKKLSDLGSMLISGPSLTAEGFNEALQQIQSEARA